MPRNASLGPGRVTIASGAGSLQLPEHVTVSTGKHSEIPENVEIIVRRGNTVRDPVYSEWVPMHGARVTYRKYHKNLVSTVYDDHTVTFLCTGPWKVQAELPRK
jgi:hypothetical protein